MATRFASFSIAVLSTNSPKRCNDRAMSTALIATERRTSGRGLELAAGMIVLSITAAILAGAIPIAFSIATVFLFAGPHNWMEARYILGRLPARTGKLTGF